MDNQITVRTGYKIMNEKTTIVVFNRVRYIPFSVENPIPDGYTKVAGAPMTSLEAVELADSLNDIKELKPLPKTNDFTVET